MFNGRQNESPRQLRPARRARSGKCAEDAPRQSEFLRCIYFWRLFPQSSSFSLFILGKHLSPRMFCSTHPCVLFPQASFIQCLPVLCVQHSHTQSLALLPVPLPSCHKSHSKPRLLSFETNSHPSARAVRLSVRSHPRRRYC